MSPWVDPIPPVVKVAQGAQEPVAPARRHGASPGLHDVELLRRQPSRRRQKTTILVLWQPTLILGLGSHRHISSSARLRSTMSTRSLRPRQQAQRLGEARQRMRHAVVSLEQCVVDPILDAQASLAADKQQVAPVHRYAPGDDSH